MSLAYFISTFPAHSAPSRTLRSHLIKHIACALMGPAQNTRPLLAAHSRATQK